MDVTVLRSSLLFPAVARLNLSQNELVSIPSTISFLDNLGTLILRDNSHLREVCFFSEYVDRSIDFAFFHRFRCHWVQCKNYGILIFMVADALLKNELLARARAR